MTSLDELATPALLLDLDVLERNLAGMARRTRELGVALRPHAKTHKCVEIARRQQQLGARGLTVSTLEEARVFAEAGFDDITWAFPVIPGRLGEVRELTRRIHLGVVVDSAAAIAHLDAGGGPPLSAWLKVDCGYHRSGVDPRSELAVELAARLAAAPSLRFAGLLTHSGHAYHATSREQMRAVAEEERSTLVELATRLRRQGIEVEEVSVGSTPAMAAVESLEGVTEARPGNYAFYDFTQVCLGSASAAECAVTVLASVVSCQPGNAHSVVDAGALALSKDTGPPADLRPGPAGMGEIFDDYAAGTLRPDARLVALSQEHGIVDAPFPVGRRLRILPNHSCLTVACFDAYQVVRGNTVVDRWTIHRRR